MYSLLIDSINRDEILAEDMRQKLVNQCEKDIANKIKKIQGTENRKMSLLDLAEWIEILIVQMGSNRDFISYWSSAFNGINSSKDAFYIWTSFATNYYSRRKLFSFLLSDNVSSRSKILYHFLAEHESKLRCVISGSVAIIPHKEDLDIEHFLPSGSTAAISSWPYCGFKNQGEYWSACGTLGNMLLLDAPLNRSIRNEIAPVKLTAYKSGKFASTTAKIITEQSKEFDCQVTTYGLPAVKYYLRLRRLDLLVFLITRF